MGQRNWVKICAVMLQVRSQGALHEEPSKVLFGGMKIQVEVLRMGAVEEV